MNRKKVVLTLLVLFLGFWMFSDPKGFAVAAKALGAGSWALLTDVFNGLIRFARELA
ncbi:hypothetical protein ACFP3Q_10520 [Nocardioides sp. GCM10027113]|uniref:hypothetical protein n=1 Tax=unclassified Nocardioides TaxID=2615069 RepID=UPI00360B7AB0